MSRREHDRQDNDYNKRSRHERKEKKSTHDLNDDSSRDRRKDSRHSHKKRSRKDEPRDDDKARKRRKHSYKDTDERDRKSRKSRRDDDDKRRRKRHKDRKNRNRSKHDKDSGRKKSSKVDKSKLIDLGDPLGAPPTQLLDKERDYFAYHQQLWVYLHREEGLVANDLSSDEAREAFARFVAMYNSGKLEKAYYDGFSSEVLEECKTTRHNWSFNTSKRENQSLHALQEGIRKQTEYRGETNSTDEPFRKADSGRNPTERISQAEPSAIPSAKDRHTERAANRRLRERVRTAEEEFSGGRKEGRERQIEKRKS